MFRKIGRVEYLLTWRSNTWNYELWVLTIFIGIKIEFKINLKHCKDNLALLQNSYKCCYEDDYNFTKLEVTPSNT